MAKNERWKRPSLRYTVGSEGQKIYDVKASKVKDYEFKALVKQANERLRQIEKRGLEGYSREYELVKRYATGDPEGRGAIYNVNEETGAIRFSSNLNKFVTSDKPFKSQAERRAYMINTLRNFLNAETSTVSGIKAVQKRSFEAFKKNYKDRFPEMTQADYSSFWKTFRENVSDTKKDHFGYDTLKILLDNSNVLSLDEEKLDQVMSVIESSRNAEDGWIAIENIQEQVPGFIFEND